MVVLLFLIGSGLKQIGVTSIFPLEFGVNVTLSGGMVGVSGDVNELLPGEFLIIHIPSSHFVVIAHSHVLPASHCLHSKVNGCVPGGRVVEPGGNVVEPGGNVVDPGGRVVEPGGNVVDVVVDDEVVVVVGQL